MNVLELTEPRGGISNFRNCSHCSGWEDKDGGSAQLRRSREHAEDLATSGHTAQSGEREKYLGIFFSCHCLPLTGPHWKRDLMFQPLVFRPEQEYAESGSEDQEANVAHIKDLVQTQKAHQEFEEY